MSLLRAKLQVLSDGSGFLSNSVIVSVTRRRSRYSSDEQQLHSFLFQCPSSAQRLAKQRGLKLKQFASHGAVCLTRLSAASCAGLPGCVFGLSGLGAAELAVHGPSGTQGIVHSLRHFVRRRFPELRAADHAVPAQLLDSPFFRVVAVPIPQSRSGSPLNLSAELDAKSNDTKRGSLAADAMGCDLLAFACRVFDDGNGKADGSNEKASVSFAIVDCCSIEEVATRFRGSVSLRGLDVVVHLASQEVASSAVYREFASESDGALHVFLHGGGDENGNSDLDGIAFRSSARQTVKLATLLPPGMLPQLRPALRAGAHDTSAKLSAVAKVTAFGTPAIPNACLVSNGDHVVLFPRPSTHSDAVVSAREQLAARRKQFLLPPPRPECTLEVAAREAVDAVCGALGLGSARLDANEIDISDDNEEEEGGGGGGGGGGGEKEKKGKEGEETLRGHDEDKASLLLSADEVLSRLSPRCSLAIEIKTRCRAQKCAFAPATSAGQKRKREEYGMTTFSQPPTGATAPRQDQRQLLMRPPPPLQPLARPWAPPGPPPAPSARMAFQHGLRNSVPMFPPPLGYAPPRGEDEVNCHFTAQNIYTEQALTMET